VAVDRNGRRSLRIGLSTGAAPIKPTDVRFLEKPTEHGTIMAATLLNS
jgi:hypothetical protein